MNAATLLTSRARLSPSTIGVIDRSTGRSFTFDELDRRAHATARMMREHFHVHRSDRVALLAPNGIVYVDLLFGLSRIGAILVPLNWRLTLNELRPIVLDCSPVVLLSSQEYLDTAQSLAAAGAISAVMSLDHPKSNDPESYERVLASTDSAPVDPVDVSPDDALAILYTSGTTGTPKGAMIPHRQVFWNCVNTIISWGVTANDVSPIFTPMFHAGGLFVFLTPLLYVGGRTVLASGLTPREMLDVITEERCTVTLGVPTLFQSWLQESALRKPDFSSVRWFVSGGAPCSPSLVCQWHKETGTILRQGYGLTEAGVNCFSMSNEEALAHAGSVGKPIFHSRMRVVDPAGNDVSPDAAGELLIRGDHVFKGYWKNPEASSIALRDGWLHTGDIARCDRDGLYWIVGRFKDMIISGGENIYAAEVEAVFKEHPAVADAALVGQPDERWGEVGVLAVVLKPHGVATAGELLHHCSDRIARYKIPKRVVFLNELPVSPYGKVMKEALKKMVSPA